MRKYLAALLTLLLVAAAFFLPARLARWGDAQLLDVPHITAEEEREGFAETLQLTSGEKLLLLRSSNISSMDVGAMMVQGLYVTPIPGENGSPGSIEHGVVTFRAAVDSPGFNGVLIEEEERGKLEAEGELVDLQVWDDRVASAWTQVRSLQSLGGLPELWPSGAELEYAVYGDVLYLDSATQISFQTYRVSLACAPYSLELTVDAQSGRVFAFVLRWDKGSQISWGPRGSGSFGAAWRDYWKLDKVSAEWYTPYTKEILECPPESLNINGDYNGNGQVVFSYDDQAMAVSLSNWVYSEKECSLRWNS